MLNNFVLCKSWARKLLYQNASSSMFCVEPNLCALWVGKRKNLIEGFGYNWKKSLGRGRNHGMAHKTRDEKQKIFNAL